MYFTYTSDEFLDFFFLFKCREDYKMQYYRWYSVHLLLWMNGADSVGNKNYLLVCPALNWASLRHT